MTPVANTPLPQAITPAKAQTESPSSNQAADGQGSESFAQVLSRRVDSQDSASGKESSTTSGAASNETVPADNAAQTTAPTSPTDPLAAILSQIPVEARGNAATSLNQGAAVTDSAAATLAGLARAAATPMAASGDLNPTGNADARSGTKAAISLIEGSTAATPNDKPAIQANALRQDDFAAALKDAGDKLAAGEKMLAGRNLNADSLRSDRSSEQASLLAGQQATIAQQAATSANQNASPSASQTIPTPLGNPTWGDDFSQKVNWLVGQKSQIAELHLNPPNLGPLDVSLKIADNQATVLFTSPHAMVREAVENALPKLRELLADNGIMLSNASVGDQAPREQQTNEFTGRDGNTGGTLGSRQEGAESPVATRTTTIQRHNGVLDTFA